MMSATLVLMTSVVAAPHIQAGAPPPPSSAAFAPWRQVRELSLPQTLRWAIGLRWTAPTTARLNIPSKGLMEISWASEPPTHQAVALRGVGKPSLTIFLGQSGDWTALGSPLGEVVFWHASGSPSGRARFATVEALDVGGDRLAVLGLRETRGKPAPDGAVGWVGSLRAGLADLRPIYYSQDGPGAARMVACGFFGLGKVRFLPDGSLLLVPGAEPNAYWYGPDGGLRRLVDLAPLGAAPDCRLTAKQEATYTKDPVARWEWFNRHTLVDDVLPFPDGPALVVRRHREGVTWWEFAHVGKDGTLRVEPLPLAVSSPWSHLEGDVNGQQILALLREAGPPLGPPVAPPRLVLLERRP